MNAFNQNFVGAGVEIIHHMPHGDGVYIKETRIPRGVTLLNHKHTYTHKAMLVRGRVELITGAETVDIIDAPCLLTIEKDIQHQVTALCDSVWYCIHASGEEDSDKIDHTLVGS